jgi:signal transduction histidine kinase
MSVTDTLAGRCLELQRRLSAAGRDLHDDAGGLLAAAGLRLQLLEADHPQAAAAIREVSAILGQAMESIRAVSQSLRPSPAYRGGLKRALLTLGVNLVYSSRAALSPQAAEAVFGVVEAVVAISRAAGASNIRLRVTGSRQMTIRIVDDGNPRGRLRALAPLRVLARAAGLQLAQPTEKGTIVLIRVPVRHPPGSSL